jgi:DNA-binding MarR family transcriptional regulator
MIDPLAKLPGYSLRRASVAMLEELTARLSAVDLRFTEASVLLMIDANPGVIQAELGRAMGIQRANMVPLIARLADRGLLDRVRLDGRSHGLSLSGLGVILIPKVHAIIQAHEAALLEKIPERVRSAFVDALAQLWGQGACD